MKTFVVTLTAEVQVEIELDRDEGDENIELAPWEEDDAIREAEGHHIYWQVSGVEEVDA